MHKRPSGSLEGFLLQKNNAYMLAYLFYGGYTMEKIDLYEEVLERRIYNLEKRIRWVMNDLWFLKETHKKLYPQKQFIKKRVEQLELFTS